MRVKNMPETNPAVMTITEVLEREAQIVDARRAGEYSDGHIPGAISLPLWDIMTDSPDDIASIAGRAGIDQHMPVVVYDDTFGAVAARVAWALEYAGHDNVRLLEVTYGSWKARGLDTDTVRPTTNTSTWKPAVRRDSIATRQSIADRSDSVVLMDNRERLNYLEQHIPGAINIPYRMLGGTDGHILLPPEELRRLFGNRDITNDAEIITYCGSAGTLSGLAYYALKSAGIGGAVQLYAKSFREWKAENESTETQPDANYWDLSAE